MTNWQYPFEHPATHADWLPELDPDFQARIAPEGYDAFTGVVVPQPYAGEVRDLAAPRLTESDTRELTPEEQDRLLREAMGYHRAEDISHQIGSGMSAEDILAAEQARLDRLLEGMVPKEDRPDDPMGPDIDPPAGF